MSWAQLLDEIGPKRAKGGKGLQGLLDEILGPLPSPDADRIREPSPVSPLAAGFTEVPQVETFERRPRPRIAKEPPVTPPDTRRDGVIRPPTRKERLLQLLPKELREIRHSIIAKQREAEEGKVVPHAWHLDPKTREKKEPASYRLELPTGEQLIPVGKLDPKRFKREFFYRPDVPPDPAYDRSPQFQDLPSGKEIFNAFIGAPARRTLKRWKEEPALFLDPAKLGKGWEKRVLAEAEAALGLIKIPVEEFTPLIFAGLIGKVGVSGVQAQLAQVKEGAYDSLARGVGFGLMQQGMSAEKATRVANQFVNLTRAQVAMKRTKSGLLVPTKKEPHTIREIWRAERAIRPKPPRPPDVEMTRKFSFKGLPRFATDRFGNVWAGGMSYKPSPAELALARRGTVSAPALRAMEKTLKLPDKSLTAEQALPMLIEAGRVEVVTPEPATPKELESLAREARKYRTAEEFVEAKVGSTLKPVSVRIFSIREIEPIQKKITPKGHRKYGEVYARDIEKAIKKGKEIPSIIIQTTRAGKYSVVDGKHRFRALQRAGINEFPAILVEEFPDVSKKTKIPIADFHAQATKAPKPTPAERLAKPLFKAGQTTEQKLIEFNKLIRGEGWTAVPSSPQIRQFIRNLPENIRKKEAIKVFEQVERALRQKTLTLGQIQKSIREATGQAPSPFIRKREYTLLKDRLRNIARGAKEAATFTRKEIRAVQTELLDILDHSRMNPVDKAKFRRTIKNVQTREQLNKMLPDFKKRVIDLIEKRERRVLKYAIKKELRKITPEKDKPGRTSVVYEFLRRGLKQKYFEHGRFRTQAQNETLLEELQTKIENYDIANPVHREDFVLHALLSEDTKGFDEMSAGELDAVLTRIKQTRRIARDSFLWKQLERAADLTEKIEGSIENMRGKGLRPQTPTNKRRLRNRLMQFVSTVDIFDRGFLQIVNLLDSIRGGRFFRDALYQPVMEGNRDYFVQDNKFMEADKKFFEKVFNKKGLLLDRQISNLKKQQNLGMVKDAKGTEHNLWFSNSEMIDIYLYGQTKPTLKAMKEQGIYVGGDNPKTRVFYMTNEVLQKIEGKMSREAKLIVEHIKKNIQDNEFIKAMVTAYEAKYNKPFPFVKEAYWTMVRRYMGRQQKGHDVFNPEYSRDAIISPSSFKLRVKNNNPLVVSDGWGKFVRWRRDIQKFISYDKALVDAKAVIGNPDFKSEFIEKYGYKSYRHLMDGFNVVATGGKRYDDMLAHSANYIRQLLSINFVGGRPVRSLVGQTSSFVAAIAEVPARNFAKSIEEFIANPGKAYNMMMRSPIIALRHKRADFTRGLLEQETRQFQRYGVSPARMAMFFVKTGDMGGVLGAGYAVYNYNFAQYIKGGMSKAKADQLAMQDMEVFVVSTQQSALPELRNWIMQQHPIIRTAGAFQQTQAQYRAKGFEAMNTWLNSENKWSKENFGRMFKRVATYHFTLPTLFELSRGNINPISMASRVIFTPISGFMGHGQVAEWAIKLAIFSTLVPLLALDEDKWEKILPFNPTTLIGESKHIFERTFKSAQDMLSQKGDPRDILRLIDSTLLMLKVPAKNIREEYVKFHDILTGADNSFLRILETEWQAEQRRKEQEKKERPRKRKGLDALLEDILK